MLVLMIMTMLMTMPMLMLDFFRHPSIPPDLYRLLPTMLQDETRADGALTNWSILTQRASAGQIPGFALREALGAS